MANRAPGRPAKPLDPSTPVTAPGVAPVITAAQLAALGERMGYDSQTEFAAALGITQGYLSHLLTGKRQLVHGPLLMVIEGRMRDHRIHGATAAA